VLPLGCGAGPCLQGAWQGGAALCQTLPVPAGSARALPESTAEPVGEAGGASVETYLRGQKMVHEQQRRGKKRVRKKQREHHGVRGAPWWSRYLVKLWTLHQSRRVFPEGNASLWGGPTLGGKKRERKGSAGRKGSVLPRAGGSGAGVKA